ncbi:MAG: putative lipid II flippase FtsW [Actinomycetota bacterium]
MTATQPRGKKVQKNAARGRHPTARATPDGRGPRRPIGRRTTTFLALFAATSMLTALGAVMVLSASAASSIAETDSAWSLFQRQLMWVGLGAVTMLVTLRIDYHRWRILAVPSLIGCGVLLVAVLLPGVGLSANGATRWLGFGPVTMQPSELLKFAMVLFVADLLARPGRPMDNPAITVRPITVVTAVFVALLMLQPHLGAVLVIGTTVFAMLFLAGAPLGHLFAIGTGGGALAAAAVLATPWRRDRFLAFLDPWADPAGVGYQPLQSLHAITKGGWSGVGLGASYAKWGFLPFAHTDFIFAIVAEELGLLGAVSVFAGFVVIGVAGITAALRAPDRFGMLLAVGITTWVVVQALLNMGAVMAILPVMGVTLPFLSFGGSSMVVTLGAMGVLMNVARQGH